MNDMSNLFVSYIPCSGSKKVRIGDGSLSSLARKGTIQISKNLQLKYVLHVLKLTCKLFSVSQFTNDQNCIAISSSTHCVFQHLASGKRIGSARFEDGLYDFEEGSCLKGKFRLQIKLPLFVKRMKLCCGTVD